MARLVAFVVLAAFLGVAAANNDDGFVWIDANTKIRLTPLGKAAAGATAPEKAPQKEEKRKEKPRK